MMLSIVTFFFSACSGSHPDWQDLPKSAPAAARFTLLQGGYVPIQQYRGQVVVLLFWGSWCSASKSLAVKLNSMAANVRRDRVVFLATSIDKAEDENKLLNFIRAEKLQNLQHAFSGNEGYDEAFNAFKLSDVPNVFVIDEMGNVVSHSRSTSGVSDYLQARGL